MLNHLFKPVSAAPAPAFTPKPFGLEQATIEARLAICTGCGFNIEWKCEHSGCAICPGKARQMGDEPLKTLLTKLYFKCPMRKF